MTPRDERGTLPGGPGRPDWRHPSLEQPGLSRYLAILRERIWLIVACVAVTTAAALVYLAVADKTYEAEADLLVTPVSAEEQVPGAGLISESPDPTRDVETAARLVTQRDVAARVARELGLETRPVDLLSQVTAEPVAQSNIVAVTASDSSPTRARELANAFGAAAVQERTDQLHSALDRLIPGIEGRIEAAGGSDQASPSLVDQLATYETLREGSDPTLRLETRAATPEAAASPRPKLTILAGIFAGLVLGVGGAFLLHAIDPRLRREEQLRELYRLPVLARIPREARAPTADLGPRRMGIGPRHRERRALAPDQLSPMTAEAYRTLRAMLSAQHEGEAGGKSVLITGPSPSEGKTTTAINLATSFARGGSKVILIEADFRRPTVGAALGVKPRVGIGRVLLGRTSLERALVAVEPFGDDLRLLLVGGADESVPEVLSLPTAAALLEEAERLADIVIIDSPPLTEVIDALPLAQRADDVVIVVRLGSSRITQLQRLGDVLEQNGIDPTGFAVVGVGTSEKETYYLSAQRERMVDERQGWEERAGAQAPSARS